MERAAERLSYVIPATLLLIFVLLYFNFRDPVAPMLVMLTVPFALVGSFWLLYWLEYNLSVAVAVGFIALAGVAVETGVLVLTFIQEAIAEKRVRKGSFILDTEEIREAVLSGTSRRVRAVTMTTTSTIVGLVPIMFLSGSGADAMQRIAAPMIGGMLTTMLLSLLVLPVIYSMALEATSMASDHG